MMVLSMRAAAESVAAGVRNGSAGISGRGGCGGLGGAGRGGGRGVGSDGGTVGDGGIGCGCCAGGGDVGVG